MEIIGIIAEYNPFHNGHLYHINKIKEMYPDSLVILVLNGYFLQRGEVSLQSKEDKTKLAMNNNIDIVLELPVLYGTQSADVFADASLKILNEFKINRLIFGSEADNKEILLDIAKKELDSNFDALVKEYMNQGINYPTALSKALNMDFIYNPNDLLGISYAKAILKNNYDIEIETIKRTSDYHDLKSNEAVISASNIREKLKNNENINNYLPKDSLNYISNLDDTVLFNLLKYKIIMDDNLGDYLDVSEGLDYLLKDKIKDVTSLDELINIVKSKRYTYNRIRRMFIHILLGIKNSDAKKDLSYINILGFNNKGNKYINSIKKSINVSLKKDFDSLQYDLEIKASIIYDLIMGTNTFKYEKRNKPEIKATN